ncbi:uncharacterized protein LOC143605596 [Bidens hawaiensis]|uniref:uncharacterized protein LOC143605596 n=1 Tax=Bidens hawaiensis TaxID=980011 RepID=UPI00404AF669
MSFICSSFKNQEEDDFAFLWPSPTPLRKARSHMSCCSWNKELYNENPYSNCGLDKFQALLADLEDKKRNIFTQKGSQYISFVRFVQSDSNDVKPIVVRLKDPRKHDKDHHKKNNLKDNKRSPLTKLHGSSTLDHHRNNSKPPGDVIDVTKKINRLDHWKLNFKRKLDDWWMPSYNLPLFIILVMVFLILFGRSMAIICTSIAWYLIPTIEGTSENTTAKPKKMIKISHSRKPSENKVIASPKPFFSGPINVKQTKKMKKLGSF